MTRYSRNKDSGNLALWISISLALHALLFFSIPYTRPEKSYKIYPLANAGVIELGPSGGRVGGGPDNSKPGGTGGGGTAHFLNSVPKPNQKIEPKTAPSPPRLGKPKGSPEAAATSGKRVSKVMTSTVTGSASNVKVVKTPRVNEGPMNSSATHDIITSPNGTSSVAVNSAPESGRVVPQATQGRPDGSPSGTGSSDVQGALAGPGGAGKGAGGPGGDGDFPFAGTGEGFAVNSVPPVYPKYAESNGIEGKVGLSITVNRKGNPELITITQSSGYSVLDNACESAIKKTWRFVPVDKGYVLTLTISFKDGLVQPDFQSVKPLK